MYHPKTSITMGNSYEHIGFGRTKATTGTISVEIPEEYLQLLLSQVKDGKVSIQLEPNRTQFPGTFQAWLEKQKVA